MAAVDRVLILGPVHPRTERQLPELGNVQVHHLAADAPLEALSEHAPYDWIVVTDPTRAVAWAWIQHTRRGGRIMFTHDPVGVAARSIELVRGTSTASGRFLADDTVPDPDPDLTTASTVGHGHGARARHARTALPWRLGDLEVPWFLATATMPDGLRVSRVVDYAGGECGIHLDVARSSCWPTER